MAVDGSLIFDTKVDTKGFKSGTNTIKTQANGLKSVLVSLGKATAVAFGIKQLISFGKQAIQAASDLEEVQNVVDVAFGSMKYKMEEFADTAIESFGISKLAAKQTGSTLMAMARGMGIANNTASDMAIQLTGLSADMASFYNVSQDVASTALKSVFTGETETLKQYGIVMTEANLQEYAFAQGMNKKISAMNQSEKVMLRYGYVMQQTALAQGDFSRTSDSWANQTRVLIEKWKEFLGILGKGLVQVLMPIVKTLSGALSYLIKFANTVGEVFSKVFGFKKVIAETGGAISDASGNVRDLGSEVKSTAKEIKKSLSSFDELNILSQDIASNTNSTDIGALNPGPNIDAGNIDVIGEPDDQSALHKFLNNIAETFNKIKEAVAPFAKSVGKGFVDFMGKMVELFKPIVATVADAFGKALEFIGDMISGISPSTAEALGGALGGMVTTVLLFTGATLVAGIIKSIGKALVGLLSTVASHPLFVLALALGALVGAALSMADADASPQIVEYAEALDKLQTSANDTADEVNYFVDSITNRRSDIENEYSAIEDLADKYFVLADKVGSLSDGDKALLKAYAEEMVKKIPELDKYIDIHTGKYNGTRDAVLDLIAKTKEYQLVQAAQESLLEIRKKHYDSTMELNIITEAQRDLAKEVAEAEKKRNDALKEGTDTARENGDWTDKAVEAYKRAEKELEILRTEYKDNEDAITKLDTAIETLDTQYQYSVDYIKEHSGTLTDAQDKIVKSTDTFISDLTKKMPIGAAGIMKGFNEEIDAGLSKTEKSFKDKIDDLKKSLASTHISLGSYSFSSSSTPSSGGTSTFNPPKFATGTVVPANYGEFLGVLGDNKRETEVVSPLSTMKQAMLEALAERGGGNKDITIKFEGSMSELVRVLKPYIDKENNRVGVKLVTGGGF
jgi:hypothetical protein